MSKTLKSLRISVAAFLMATPVFAQDADTVVATVNGTDITLGHMLSVREGLPAQYQSLPEPALFSGILDQLVQQALLASTLEGAISTRAEAAIKVQTNAILANEALSAELALRIDDAALQALYDTKYGGFEGTPEFNASHILVPTEEEAIAIAADVRAGADFAETAQEKSTGPSGPRGGQLGWFGPGQMVAPFEEAVKSLEVGQISDPVQTQFGWHVIILNDTRSQPAPSFEEVRGELLNDAENAAAADFIATLTEAAEVDTSASEALDPGIISRLDLLED